MQNEFDALLSDRARELRKNMTPQERRLWYDFLCSLPIPVKRQKVIGNCIVDFYIPAAKLIIELDGSQHYETEGILSDSRRDQYFNQQGYTVLRYSNADINTWFSAVCEDILRRISRD